MDLTKKVNPYIPICLLCAHLAWVCVPQGTGILEGQDYNYS